MLKGNLNFKIKVRFILFVAASKVAALRFSLLINENIFATVSINNSHCKHLFWYLQLSEDNSQQNKFL